MNQQEQGMETGKTSTFTIHHDKCDPSKWTAHDVLAFADFVRTGNLQNAAALSRLGVQLVLSEHHVPKGGTLEEIGWAEPKGNEIYDLEDLSEDDVTELCRVYRGPVEYVAKIGVGNEHGDFEGYEYEIKPTLAEAQSFFERTP
jgi:hypothetical protein